MIVLILRFVGPGKWLKQMNQLNMTRLLRNAILQETNKLAILQATKGLNLGLQATNPASDQGKVWTHGLQIAKLVLWSFSHAAS